MKRFPLLCLALLFLSPSSPAQDDDPFSDQPEGTDAPAVLTSALEDAATLVAAEPALVNEAHEKLYKDYTAAVAATESEFSSREVSLRAAISSELEKAKTGLDAAGIKAANTAIAGLKGGDATHLRPDSTDPPALATAKRPLLARYQRLRATHGLAQANRIRDYAATLEQLQRSLATASQLGDSVVVATEIRGLRRLLAEGGTGGTPLAAFQFRDLEITGERTAIPALHSGIPLLTALGGDFSDSEAFLSLRPPAPDAKAGSQWELRGAYVPEDATGGITLMEAPLIDFPGAEITTREWRGGASSAPVKLIPAKEGFCMIGGLRGPFESGSEARISLNATDQSWYLSGKGGTKETAVSVIIVRFPDPAERPVLAAKTFSWGGQGAHVRLSDASVSFCVLTRLAGPIGNRNTAVALAIGADGFWYLQGRADTPGTAADATAFTLGPAS